MYKQKYARSRTGFFNKISIIIRILLIRCNLMNDKIVNNIINRILWPERCICHNMKLLISVVYLALATTASADETFDINDAVYNYHARIGIPEANRIRESENRQHKVVGGSITDIKYVPYQVRVLAPLY